MGKAIMRLNPKVDSIKNRILLCRALELLIACVMLLPEKKISGKGRKPFDYRKVLVLSIMRILFCKRYAAYESEMRTDTRYMEILGVTRLPSKSTLNRYDLNVFTMSLLSDLNKRLIGAWIKKPVDLALDASGIRIKGRSIWYCIRIKEKMKKKECDKIHLGVSLCSLLIATFAISKGSKNDSPFLRKILKIFRTLGLILADKGYSNKTNALFVANKKGAFFSPFKKNAVASGFHPWAYMRRLWDAFPQMCKNIYNHRNVVEAVFSAIKRRYGDELHGKKNFSRRREMAMIFISYNVRIIVGIQIAKEQNLPLWVRA